MKRIILPLVLLALSPLAAAHPHSKTPEAEPPKKSYIWPYFGKKAANDKTDSSLLGAEFADRLEQRLKTHTDKIEQSLKKAEAKNEFLNSDREIKNADDIRDAARAIEELVAESGVISSLADMMLSLAEDFDVETTDEGIALKFDGDRIGRVNVKRDKHAQSTFDVEGFGRNMTVEREVIERGGKTKTRIIIEVDGDEEFDVEFSPKN